MLACQRSDGNPRYVVMKREGGRAGWKEGGKPGTVTTCVVKTHIAHSFSISLFFSL